MLLKSFVPASVLALAGVATSALAPIVAYANPNAYVLGDSIGEGVAEASGLKKLARIGIHIRGPKALAQIEATPIGSVAFVVLGTNDADGSIKNIGKSIDDIVRAGERRRLTMIWLGPPCVRRAFDSRSRELDKILSDRLAGTAVRYISMRDERICSGVFHEPDGVHLTMKGYRYIWEKTERSISWSQLASGVAVTPPPKSTIAAEAALAAPVSTGALSGGGLPKASAEDTAVSIPANRTNSQLAQMVMEIHRPSSTASSLIVWTALRH